METKNYHRDEVYLQNQDLFRNIFRVVFKKVLKYKKRGSILEVGSSMGLLLDIFRNAGWVVQGIEPSEKSSLYAKKIGIPTIGETFEESKISGKYDVIILNHVLEHLTDPARVLKKAHRLLNNDGIIVVNVPNAGSLAARIYGDSWEYVLTKEHLWQFTPNSLNGVLSDSGFKMLEWNAVSGVWEYDNPAAEIWQSLTNFKKRFFRNVLTAIPAWFVTRLKMGTGLSVVAQKQ
ncbi:MAG: hypothetical protein A2782_03375 [Candidatus Blackburnbacteria bacterium RIFCSPHIGHO2_01_FULL_43_15b]|uniref:Methyltransferase type 11 domain-containing protein n=1 Tax=Candidatus Blackburnbacteria bacterium RIFCSPHIGHO2_01_FULL_43_15b TaxID=1797513 RepID=A0A1G1V2G7_9BACT|nr:MAG: hypothetical protein A2782_03375 [Candidatus Blackburnbacteria bacterium RIFCSPHIGHO2_01_FULL_43_15b]